jgi:integrase
MLTALRRVLRFAWRDGSLAYEDFLRLSDVEVITGEAPTRGRSLTQVELDALYGACARDVTAAGLRDGLAIALMHAGGLRSAEAAWVRFEDVMDEDAGELLLPGKGGSLGGASLGEASGWLTSWLAIRGREPGLLLHQVRANGKIAPVGLCAQAMWQIVKKRSREAKIRKCSPHDLRRTHATALLRAGFDHLMVMRSLRQRDVRSVRCYDRRPDEERAAAQRVAIRAPGPGR